MERSRVGDMSCLWEGEEGSHGIDASTTPSLTLLWKELQVLIHFFHTFFLLLILLLFLTFLTFALILLQKQNDCLCVIQQSYKKPNNTTQMTRILVIVIY